MGWRVGVDVGGTWVRVLGTDSRGRRRTLKGRAAGLGALPAFLDQAWRRFSLRPAGVDALVVSTRGVWTAAEQRAAARPLARLARRVRVIPDAQAAYHGALGDEAGVLLLAGTGSIAVGRDARGRFLRAGGLGPLVGDEGSAFWIGREWLRARLSGGINRRGFARIHRHLVAPDAVARIAAWAPSVLRRAQRGDPTARRIAIGAQSALAALGLTLARELRLPSPCPVSWAGRVLADPPFRAGVWRAARRQGLEIRPRAPLHPPVEAAVLLAHRLAAPSRSIPRRPARRGAPRRSKGRRPRPASDHGGRA